MSLTAIIAILTGLLGAASPFLPVVGPIITNLWSAFWNWRNEKVQAQSTQNSAVVAGEQAHENDGIEIVGLNSSASAQDQALNQLNDQLNHPEPIPELPKGASK